MLFQSASEENENDLAKQMSPIRAAVMESAKAKKIAKQLEEKLKTTLNKVVYICFKHGETSVKISVIFLL